MGNNGLESIGIHGLEVIGAPMGGIDAKTAKELGALKDVIGTFEGEIPYLSENLSYGIEFDTGVSSTACTRIGNLSLHKTLPVHSRMKGCLLDDDGNVVDYLDPTDWTGAVRDGSRGQVMVEIPKHYRKFETEGTKRRVLISEYPLPGYHEVKKQYVSAYQATFDRTNSKLASVVNTTTQYRGGNNTSGWDSEAKSLLGMPATSISRTNFRTYARNRKANSTEWNCMTYDMQKTLYWLFVIEYATLNSQKTYNAQLDANGYRQGGLGDGVTTINSTKWNSFNSYNPFIPCGHTDSLGNGTGVVTFTMPTAYDSENTVTVNVPRYRGVSFMDLILAFNQTSDDADIQIKQRKLISKKCWQRSVDIILFIRDTEMQYAISCVDLQRRSFGNTCHFQHCYRNTDFTAFALVIFCLHNNVSEQIASHFSEHIDNHDRLHRAKLITQDKQHAFSPIDS